MRVLVRLTAATLLSVSPLAGALSSDFCRGLCGRFGAEHAGVICEGPDMNFLSENVYLFNHRLGFGISLSVDHHHGNGPYHLGNGAYFWLGLP